MTEKQISFSGLNLTPYSDISPDGQLSASVGLEIHDGSIRPSVLAGEKYILPQSHNSAKLLYIHSATSYSHFIFQDGLSLYWADVNNKGELSLTLLDESIPARSLLSVGNTLVAFAETGCIISYGKMETTNIWGRNLRNHFWCFPCIQL